MICLSKNLTDEYVNMFAQGANLPIQDYNSDFGSNPIMIRSMGKRKLINACIENRHTFYYMDSGYFGNYKCTVNPSGWKWYHRIVKNAVQHSNIIDRPSDRWEALKQPIPRIQSSGKNILLVTPSEKPCKFYGINLEQWKKETIQEIKKHTDRPIVIREKTDRPSRVNRPIFEDFKDTWCTVTYNSIAATESVLSGIPSFTLAPNAADPVCDKDLSLIETPTKFDQDLIYKWACHLAYGQFHIDEMKSGKAYNILMETTNE